LDYWPFIRDFPSIWCAPGRNQPFFETLASLHGICCSLTVESFHGFRAAFFLGIPQHVECDTPGDVGLGAKAHKDATETERTEKYREFKGRIGRPGGTVDGMDAFGWGGGGKF
jgi:hypothetical protein